MKHEVKAPSVGESITEVSILKWAKQSGQAVKTGEKLLEIESDKATVEIVAEQNGVLQIAKEAGERIPVGAVIGFIDDSAKPTVAASAPTAAASAPAPAPAPAAMHLGGAMAAGPATVSAGMGPAARKMATEMGIDTTQIQGTGRGGRVTKGDLMQPTTTTYREPTPVAAAPTRPGERRVQMSMLRTRIAERLVQAQHTAAILTTFNEADMSAVMAMRNKHKDSFKAKNGVSLGFMSFFTRACVEALKLIPEVNAYIDGRDILYHDYCDIGVAVGTDRGLVVPVIRNAERMGFIDIEKKIAELAVKARDSKLSIAELTGGTFTISNGGVYGSLLSTPILNPPQSGILGMHKIQERPVVVNGKVEVRPMMYLALSYDHRLIDGKGAVSFLIAVKDFIENPDKLKPEF